MSKIFEEIHPSQSFDGMCESIELRRDESNHTFSSENIVQLEEQLYGTLERRKFFEFYDIEPNIFSKENTLVPSDNEKHKKEELHIFKAVSICYLSKSDVQKSNDSTADKITPGNTIDINNSKKNKNIVLNKKKNKKRKKRRK